MLSYLLPVVNCNSNVFLVPCGIHDASDSQAYELHPCVTKCSPESPNESTGVYTTHSRTGVKVLHRPCSGSRLPVLVSIYNDSIQLLFLYLSWSSRVVQECPVS